MSDSKYPYLVRYVARIVVEAETPLSVGSGAGDLLTDSPVCVDCNLLPMIQGTSLTGVLRHHLEESLGKEAVQKIFGFQEEKEGEGSRIIVSSAHIVSENEKVMEGLLDPAVIEKSNYLKQLRHLPVREHCRINHKGASDKESHGKFDQQVVFKGVRFCFELELIGTEKDKEDWKKILDAISSPTFRIGGGTRKGFGKLKIVRVESKIYDLEKEMESYLGKSSSLNSSIPGGERIEVAARGSHDWKKYVLTLSPEDTWMFGSGFSDDEADMTPVYERTVEWKENKPHFTGRKILVPATSLKGAISHRIAYHYNRLNEVFADQLGEKTMTSCVGENNEAVKALFGCAKDSASKKEKGRIGNVIFSDLFVDDKQETKIFNHVSIDRFTGGASDGALFDEKVITQKETLKLEIWVKQSAFLTKEKIKEAWEATLDDVARGMLPLGGSVMRGHGVFKGEWILSEEKK